MSEVLQPPPAQPRWPKANPTVDTHADLVVQQGALDRSRLPQIEGLPSPTYGKRCVMQ